jgi:hypothetical protein
MFDFELVGLQKMAKGYNPVKFDREFNRQLTDSARKARTLVSRQVRLRYNVKAGLLGGGKLSAVKIKVARGRRILLYRSTMLGLDKMSAKKVAVSSARGKRYGVNVTVKKGQRSRVKGGFLGKSRNRRNTFVFKRVVDSQGNTQKTRNGRDQLERLFTISVAHMVGQTPIAENGREIFLHFEQGFAKRLKKIG